MKKMIFALIAVMTMTTVAGAQERDDKRGDFKQKRIEMLAKKLNLTDEQKAAMTTIMDDTHKQLEAIEAQKKEVMDGQKAKMEQLLTPEQLAKFKEMRPEHRGEMGKRPGDGKRGDFKGEGPREGKHRGFKGEGPRKGGPKCENCPAPDTAPATE